jgi:hypothetical protein
MLTVLLFIMSAVVLAASVLLAIHKDYHSGVFGTLGLGLLAVAAFSRVTHVLGGGSELHVSSTGVLLWFGLGSLLGHITVRFMIRVLRHGPLWYPSPPNAKQRNDHSGQRDHT